MWSMTDPDTLPITSRWYTSLFTQLLVFIVAGIFVGWMWPEFGADLKPLADGFIKLIKMLIAPIIFCTVVIGIAHVGDLKSVGRIGVKALIYFEVVTTFALLFGLVIGNLVKPGAGFNIDAETLATGADAVAAKTGDSELPHTVEFLLNIIPTSAISAFAENHLLQVLFFAVLFGLALAKFGEHGPPVVFEMIDHLSTIFFTIIGWIMKLAPLAAFGAMAYIIGQYGISSLGSYAKLIAACYLGRGAVHPGPRGDRVVPRRRQPVEVRGLHQGRAVPRAGHGVHRGGAAAHHGQTDLRRMFAHHNRSGGADRVLVQPGRGDAVPVDLRAVPGPGTGRGSQYR